MKNDVLDRLRYRFDNFMAKGTIALIGGLAAISLTLILIMAVLVTLTGIAPEGSERLSFVEVVWGNLMRTMDAGTIGGDQGWSFRLAMLVVTIGGIFVFSILIGVLSSGIEAKLEELRKGRSRVIETNHIVILGWSLQIFTLLSELAIANANQPDTCIVVLSHLDKVQMEDEVSEALGKLHRTRIVCRTGSPSNMADLGMVNIQAARSIIVLSSTDEHADSQLIKTLLAVRNIPRVDSQPYHVVVQVQDPKSLGVIHLLGGNEVEVLLTNDLISRIMVQTCRQSGLSVVYMELLEFSGNEIYFKAEPALVDEPYEKALLAYEESALIGLKHADGTIHLNPLMTTRLQKGDQVILISQDDDTTHLGGSTDLKINHSAIQSPHPVAPQPENTLILGWNNRVPQIIYQLDQYVAPGSKVTLVAEVAEAEAKLALSATQLTNQAMEYKSETPTERSVLDTLQVPEYDHVIVLCSDQLEPDQADAQTLVILLQLRDIANQSGKNFPVVTEILDARNQVLAQVAKPDDFVISEQIISRMLAQVAEQKALNAVFESLFSPEGSEIYLKPVVDYVAIAEPINFYTVVEAAKQRGESAIGYRIKADADNVARGFGVVINPKKSDLITFSAKDSLIVVSES